MTEIEYPESEVKFFKTRLTLKHNESIPELQEPILVNNPLLFHKFIVPFFEEIDLYEEFFVVCVNNHLHAGAVIKLGQGGKTGTIVDLRLVAAIVANYNGNSFFVVHNHPSGIVEPSKSDIDLAEKLKNLGEIMNTNLVDFLVVSKNDFYSFATENRL